MERQENLQSKQGNSQSKQVRMEQLTEEQQKQVKKMSTARIRKRLIKAGFTELGLEGLSREELMNTLAEHMIKQELSSSEEEEEEGAVGENSLVAAYQGRGQLKSRPSGTRVVTAIVIGWIVLVDGITSFRCINRNC